MKKIKIKLPKTKKVVYVLFFLAAVLLLGITLRFLTDIYDENTCTVEIKYKTVACDGTIATFKTFEENYPVGKKISISSPKKSGYTADKEKITATVKSDTEFTVLYNCDSSVDWNVFELRYTPEFHYTDYSCTICKSVVSSENYEEHHYTAEEILIDNVHYRELSCYCGYSKTDLSDYHDFEVLQIESYPTATAPGEYVRECRMCGYGVSDNFTVLTQTITFGGDSVNKITAYHSAVDGYELSSNGYLTRLASHVPEFKFIEDGCVTILNGNTLNDNITVTLEYDESIWGENAITFKENLNYSAESKYSVSIGNNYRIIFKIEDFSGLPTWLEWLQCDKCPLTVAPIKLTVTCDFTN